MDASGRVTYTWDANPTQGGVALTPKPTSETRSGGGGGTTTTTNVAGTGVVEGRYYVKGQEVTAQEYYNRPEYQRFAEGKTATEAQIQEYAQHTEKEYTARAGGATYVSKDPRFGSRGVSRKPVTGEAYDIATGQYLPGTGALGGEKRRVDGETIDYTKQKQRYASVDWKLERSEKHAGKVMETRIITAEQVFGGSGYIYKTYDAEGRLLSTRADYRIPVAKKEDIRRPYSIAPKVEQDTWKLGDVKTELSRMEQQRQDAVVWALDPASSLTEIGQTTAASGAVGGAVGLLGGPAGGAIGLTSGLAGGAFIGLSAYLGGRLIPAAKEFVMPTKPTVEYENQLQPYMGGTVLPKPSVEEQISIPRTGYRIKEPREAFYQMRQQGGFYGTATGIATAPTVIGTLASKAYTARQFVGSEIKSFIVTKGGAKDFVSVEASTTRTTPRSIVTGEPMGDTTTTKIMSKQTSDLSRYVDVKQPSTLEVERTTGPLTKISKYDFDLASGRGEYLKPVYSDTGGALSKAAETGRIGYIGGEKGGLGVYYSKQVAGSQIVPIKPLAPATTTDQTIRSLTFTASKDGVTLGRQFGLVTTEGGFKPSFFIRDVAHLQAGSAGGLEQGGGTVVKTVTNTAQLLQTPTGAFKPVPITTTQPPQVPAYFPAGTATFQATQTSTLPKTAYYQATATQPAQAKEQLVSKEQLKPPIEITGVKTRAITAQKQDTGTITILKPVQVPTTGLRQLTGYKMVPPQPIPDEPAPTLRTLERTIVTPDTPGPVFPRTPDVPFVPGVTITPDTPGPVFPRTPDTPGPVFPPGLPPTGGPQDWRNDWNLYGRPKKGYTPSLVAVGLDIRGKKPSILTGAEVRPIPLPQPKKKKRGRKK